MIGDTVYDVPEFTDDTGGYELYRFELDNFRPELLLNLLIDALEADLDGSAYYVQAYMHRLNKTAVATRLKDVAIAMFYETQKIKFSQIDFLRKRRRYLRNSYATAVLLTEFHQVTSLSMRLVLRYQRI